MRTPRRKFTRQFKESAVKRLKSAPISEVARACDVSPSLMHRWRKELGKYRVRRAVTRRTFSKAMKRTAVRRLEAGAPLRKLAEELQVSQGLLQRWRRELRNYGSQAFSGYGNSRAGQKPRFKNVIVYLTDDEYGKVAVAGSDENTSLSAFVREGG